MLASQRSEKQKGLLRGSVVLHKLEHSRTDEIKCIVNNLQSSQALLAISFRLAFLSVGAGALRRHVIV
jgi:hypothetical protein